jgi:hypothetical protein
VRQAKPGKGGQRSDQLETFRYDPVSQISPDKAGRQSEPSVAGVRRYVLPNEAPEAYTGSRQAVW